MTLFPVLFMGGFVFKHSFLVQKKNFKWLENEMEAVRLS